MRKARAVRLFGHFPFFSVSSCLRRRRKKNVGAVRGRVGEEKGFICSGSDGGDGPPPLCGVRGAVGQLQPALLVTLTLTSCNYPFRLRGNPGSILARVLGPCLQSWCLVIKLYFKSGLSHPVL